MVKAMRKLIAKIEEGADRTSIIFGYKLRTFGPYSSEHPACHVLEVTFYPLRRLGFEFTIVFYDKLK